MSIASTTSKSGPYACNGATVAFALSFACLATSDLLVVRTDTSGVDTTLVLTTDYSVSLNSDQTGSPGGTVTLAVAPATGFQLSILRNVSLTQETSLPNQGAWYPKVVENALDKLTMIVQQLGEKVNRAVVAGVTIDPTALLASINNAVNSAISSATSSSNSATASSNSATEASGFATAASGSATAASASAAAAALSLPIPATTGKNTTWSLTPNAAGNNTQWTQQPSSALYSGTWSLNAYNAFMSASVSTLPDLTTCTDSFGVTVPANASAVPATLTASDGWTIATGFSAGTSKSIAPSNRATPHGLWGSIVAAPPVLATYTGAGVPTIYATVAMPGNIIVVFFGDGVNLLAVAFDTVGNTVGSAITIDATFTQTMLSAFQDTSTTLIVSYTSAGTSKVMAMSISSVTLTPGAAITSSNIASAVMDAPMVKLTTGFYVVSAKKGQTAIGVAGTVCVKSTNATFGSGIVAGLQTLSTTTALIAGQAVATTNGQGGAVLTVGGTTSAPTIALGTTNFTGVCNAGSPANFGLIPFDATHFLLHMTNVAGNGSSMYMLSVSGGLVTLGTVLDNTQLSGWPVYIPVTYVNPPAQKYMTYSATQIIHGALVGAAMISYSGSVLTSGTAQLSGQTAGGFQRDFANATWFFVGTTAFDVFTISGSTFTSSEQVVAVPTVFFNATLNNKLAKYSGTWYTQLLGALIPVSASKAIAASGNNLLLNGSIT
jgi:hypothetical protein